MLIKIKNLETQSEKNVMYRLIAQKKIKGYKDKEGDACFEYNEYVAYKKTSHIGRPLGSKNKKKKEE